MGRHESLLRLRRDNPLLGWERTHLREYHVRRRYTQIRFRRQKGRGCLCLVWTEKSLDRPFPGIALALELYPLDRRVVDS